MSLYQPFLDFAIDLLSDKLNLSPYPIPPGFDRQETTTGKGKRLETVITTSVAYSTPKLRQIRAAHVRGGGALQVLNFVIFPQPNYDLPFFGADLVTLPGGHLIAIDLQPLFRDDPAYRDKYTEPILPIFRTHQEHLSWGGDFPEEAKPFFSEAFLWTRPEKTETVKTRVYSAFCDYLTAYLDFVSAAVAIDDIDKQKHILQAQLRYVKYRAEKDPARGMFARLYGEEWTEEYIHGFLFDLPRKIPQLLPSL